MVRTQVVDWQHLTALPIFKMVPAGRFCRGDAMMEQKGGSAYTVAIQGAGETKPD